MADAIRPLSAPAAPPGVADRSPRRYLAADLPEHLQRKVRQMRAKDQELRLGHLDPALLRYELGPDGRRYAVERMPTPPPARAQAEEKTSNEPQEPSPAKNSATAQNTGESAVAKKSSARGNHPAADLPGQTFRGLTPAKLLLQARVEAAYQAAAATGPRINLTV